MNTVRGIILLSFCMSFSGAEIDWGSVSNEVSFWYLIAFLVVESSKELGLENVLCFCNGKTILKKNNRKKVILLKALNNSKINPFLKQNIPSFSCLSQIICIYCSVTAYFSSLKGRRNEGKQLDFFVDEIAFRRAEGKLHLLLNKKKKVQNMSNDKKIFHHLPQKSVRYTIFISFQSSSIWSLPS